MPLRQRVEIIAKNVYGADGVSWTPEAEAKAKAFEADPDKKDYFTMMVKTHLSLSHDPDAKGVPKGWILPVRDVLIFSGARFLCPVTGNDHPDAGHRLRPCVQKDRRRCEDGQGHGIVLDICQDGRERPVGSGAF